MARKNVKDHRLKKNPTSYEVWMKNKKQDRIAQKFVSGTWQHEVSPGVWI